MSRIITSHPVSVFLDLYPLWDNGGDPNCDQCDQQKDNADRGKLERKNDSDYGIAQNKNDVDQICKRDGENRPQSEVIQGTDQICKVNDDAEKRFSTNCNTIHSNPAELQQNRKTQDLKQITDLHEKNLEDSPKICLDETNRVNFKDDTSNLEILANKSDTSLPNNHDTSSIEILANKSDTSEPSNYDISNAEIGTHKSATLEANNHDTSSKEILALKSATSEPNNHGICDAEIGTHKSGNAECVTGDTTRTKVKRMVRSGIDEETYKKLKMFFNLTKHFDSMDLGMAAVKHYEKVNSLIKKKSSH